MNENTSAGKESWLFRLGRLSNQHADVIRRLDTVERFFNEHGSQVPLVLLIERLSDNLDADELVLYAFLKKSKGGYLACFSKAHADYLRDLLIKRPIFKAISDSMTTLSTAIHNLQEVLDSNFPTLKNSTQLLLAEFKQHYHVLQSDYDNELDLLPLLLPLHGMHNYWASALSRETATVE